MGTEHENYYSDRCDLEWGLSGKNVNNRKTVSVLLSYRRRL